MSREPCDPGARRTSADLDTLRAAYSLLSELLASADRSVEVPPGRLDELRARLAEAPADVTGPIDAFRSGWANEPIEPAARRPLYLGAYLFDDPERTDGADPRNGFLLETLNLFWYFGLDPTGAQPPDYLPLMVDFAAESAGRVDVREGARARRHFLEHHLAPGLVPLRAVLERASSPLVPLIRALEAAVAADLAGSAHLAPPAETSERPARKLGVRSLPMVRQP